MPDRAYIIHHVCEADISLLCNPAVHNVLPSSEIVKGGIWIKRHAFEFVQYIKKIVQTYFLTFSLLTITITYAKLKLSQYQ